MHTKLSHTNYDCFEILNSENIECPIDIEYSLPDYCPDIQKILKCIPYVQLNTYSFTGDKFMCEGKLILHVEYMDEKTKSLRVCEIVKEYSTVKEIILSAEKTFGKVNVSTGHIVCRALSARKLDIHAPVKLEINVIAKKQNKLNPNAEGLEKLIENITVSDAIDIVNHQFVIEQEIPLSQSSTPIDSILRKDINVSNVKTNCVNDKIQIEAMLDLNIVYRSFSENFTVEKVNYSLPLSQYIDAVGCDSDCIACPKINCFELSVQAKEDEVGENTICQVFAKFSCDIEVYKNKEISIISDAYSTSKECNFEYKNINLVHMNKNSSEKMSYTKNIFLAEDEIEKLLDYWCEESSVTAYCEKSRIIYRAKFNICLLYQGKTKQVFSLTKSFDFNFTREFKDINQRKADCFVKMNIKDFKIVDGNNVEFNCEGNLYYTEFISQNKKILWNVEELNEELLEKDASIKIYYSKKDESLWNIGKIYHISVDDLIANNNLSDSTSASGEPLIIY